MRQLRLGSRIVAAASGAAVMATTALTVLTGPAPAQADFPRHRAHSAAEVAAHVVPPGGIKTAMTGGNTVGASLREARPRKDGYRHVDTPRLIQRLRSVHANTYTFGIWDSPTDWDDLVKEFAPAAQRAGIRIMVYLVPPSECANGTPLASRGKCSRPYLLDFVKWATEIATLSRQRPNVVAWAIDDFVVGDNAKLFTPDYMQQIVDAADAINPDLGFYTTAYYNEATGTSFYDRYGPYIDGIIHPYLGGASTQDATEVGRVIDTIRTHTVPRGLGLIFLIYTGRFLDAAVSPTESYVYAAMRAAAPYAADGRIQGQVAYGMPVDDKPAMSSDDHARTGAGRLAFTLSPGSGTQGGNYAQATQVVNVDPNAPSYRLDFFDLDRYANVPEGVGYHFKQVLVDGEVAWQSDVEDDGGFSWQHRSVDLAAALRGKTKATLAFRLYERNGVGSFPLNVSIDDVRATGFSVRNAGFENTSAWTLSADNEQLHPLIDVYAPDRPARIRAAIAASYGNLRYAPAPIRPSKAGNDAMYGHGRLSLSVAPHTATTAGSCASASQVVRVDPRSPRYEISFWHIDQWDGPPSRRDTQIKMFKVDGQDVFVRDTLDPWQYLWMNGHDWQGPIDISELVRGKSSVTLTFALCEKKAVTDFPVDVGFDNIESIGLDIRNPGFDYPGAWKLSSDGGARADIKIA
ncbi:hypothetical protein [Fodinicola acaciae]|uniref:hypothetical protein n=1 Tax=Fodinicola acaciae TaxID=2681555 RepID=UPI0013D48068|nr:hypothetical protein [Fodinicola acaciae]